MRGITTTVLDSGQALYSARALVDRLLFSYMFVVYVCPSYLTVSPLSAYRFSEDLLVPRVGINTNMNVLCLNEDDLMTDELSR